MKSSEAVFLCSVASVSFRNKMNLSDLFDCIEYLQHPEGAGPLRSLHWDHLCGGPVTTIQKVKRAPTYRTELTTVRRTQEFLQILRLPPLTDPQWILRGAGPEQTPGGKDKSPLRGTRRGFWLSSLSFQL